MIMVYGRSSHTMHLANHPFSEPAKMREFLTQTRYWVDGSLARIRLDTMETDYLLSVMLHLLERASKIKFAYEMHYRVKGADQEKLNKFAEMSAESFIRETPLFQAMQARYLELMTEDDSVAPWLSLDPAEESNEEDDDFPY